MQQPVQPRINMIAAIDTEGEIYFALMLENTNDDTIRLFLYRLVEQLDGERADWRSDTFQTSDFENILLWFDNVLKAVLFENIVTKNLISDNVLR